MKRVFVGGSRRISQLPDSVCDRACKMIQSGLQILVGDANGADKALQEYFALHGYQNVLVYCTGLECRNNLGDWEIRRIDCRLKSRGFQYYAAKDLAMSKEAHYGFMLWDGHSIGTLNNVLNLLERRKQAVVYFAPEERFVTLARLDEVENLLARCETDAVGRFEQRLNLRERLTFSEKQISFPFGPSMGRNA
ncbi:MAG: hypothetical protein IT365_27720 [Candidatus Hydrogenedentes bacterium]|nr:hypothetical protein [Candidatus Hydrogenedentota bacterium]